MGNKVISYSSIVFGVCFVVFLWRDATSRLLEAQKKIGKQATLIQQYEQNFEQQRHSALLQERVLLTWGQQTKTMFQKATETASDIQEARSETVDLDLPLPTSLIKPLKLRSTAARNEVGDTINPTTSSIDSRKKDSKAP